eukprot:gene2753-1738_t
MQVTPRSNHLATPSGQYYNYKIQYTISKLIQIHKTNAQIKDTMHTLQATPSQIPSKTRSNHPTPNHSKLGLANTYCLIRQTIQFPKTTRKQSYQCIINRVKSKIPTIITTLIDIYSACQQHDLNNFHLKQTAHKLKQHYCSNTLTQSRQKQCTLPKLNISQALINSISASFQQTSNLACYTAITWRPSNKPMLPQENTPSLTAPTTSRKVLNHYYNNTPSTATTGNKGLQDHS